MGKSGIAAVTAGLLVMAQGASAQNAHHPEKLLETSTDAVGTPLAYPSGKPVITSYMLHAEAGRKSAWHKHEVPVYVHVLEGTFTIDYGDKGTKTFQAGDSFIEGYEVRHHGWAEGDRPAKLLVVFVGSDTAKNRVDLP